MYDAWMIKTLLKKTYNPKSPTRARKDGTMSKPVEPRDQLTQLADAWVTAVKDSAVAKTVYQDAMGTMKHMDNRVIELAEKLKKCCTAQISKGGRVTILTPNAKAGAIVIEKGRVVEVEKDEIVGLPESKEDTGLGVL